MKIKEWVLMVKTMGSIDKVSYRKTRSDLGKKRTHYKGKPCKHKKKSFYSKRKRIGHKTSIKIRALFRVPMSTDGYRNWDKFPQLKPKLRKEVTNMKLSPVFIVNTKEIDTQSKFEEYFASRLWEGKFVMMGLSNGKTKTHRKWAKGGICVLSIKENPEGNVAKIIEKRNLRKYGWFYKG